MTERHVLNKELKAEAMAAGLTEWQSRKLLRRLREDGTVTAIHNTAESNRLEYTMDDAAKIRAEIDLTAARLRRMETDDEDDDGAGGKSTETRSDPEGKREDTPPASPPEDDEPEPETTGEDLTVRGLAERPGPVSTVQPTPTPQPEPSGRAMQPSAELEPTDDGRGEEVPAWIWIAGLVALAGIGVFVFVRMRKPQNRQQAPAVQRPMRSQPAAPVAPAPARRAPGVPADLDEYMRQLGEQHPLSGGV